MHLISGELIDDRFVDAGALYVGVKRSRTWRERLFSRPWRPWVATVRELKPLGCTAGALRFTLSPRMEGRDGSEPDEYRAHFD